MRYDYTDEQRAAWNAAGLPPKDRQGPCADGTTDGHTWQPLSFVFETQLLDRDGRVNIRQPGIDDGRVYCVCMTCHKHTYIVTQWAGFFLSDPWVNAEEAADEG